MSHESPIAVSYLDIVFLYQESQSLIGYWLFLLFALGCHISDRQEPGTGWFFRLLASAVPILWYFNQPLEPGEVLHLALPTICAWTFLGLHLLKNPLSTIVSFYLGAQAYKHISKD